MFGRSLVDVNTFQPTLKTALSAPPFFLRLRYLVFVSQGPQRLCQLKFFIGKRLPASLDHLVSTKKTNFLPHRAYKHDIITYLNEILYFHPQKKITPSIWSNCPIIPKPDFFWTFPYPKPPIFTYF